MHSVVEQYAYHSNHPGFRCSRMTVRVASCIPAAAPVVRVAISAERGSARPPCNDAAGPRSARGSQYCAGYGDAADRSRPRLRLELVVAVASPALR
jgi:hypothetical protein